MEQIDYDKLQYDITRNKYFTMIEQPGPSKHLSTLKDRYRCQQRLQILRLDHRGRSLGTGLNIFREIFLPLSGFR